MRYITDATYSRLSREISNEITTDELAKYIKYDVFFLSKKDRKFLWKLAELFGNEKAIKISNKKDDKSWVTPPSSPKYHIDKNCEALTHDYVNLSIPSVVEERKKTDEFRRWFKHRDKEWKKAVKDGENSMKRFIELVAQPGLTDILSREEWGDLNRVIGLNSGVIKMKYDTVNEVKLHLDKVLKSIHNEYYKTNLRDVIDHNIDSIDNVSNVLYDFNDTSLGLSDKYVREVLTDFKNKYYDICKDLIYNLIFKTWENKDVSHSDDWLDQMGVHPCGYCCDNSKYNQAGEVVFL
jgi:hypothetical protein